MIAIMLAAAVLIVAVAVVVAAAALHAAGNTMKQIPLAGRRNVLP